MPSAGFETATPVSQRPQTHTLDGAATGVGIKPYRFSEFSWVTAVVVIASAAERLLGSWVRIPPAAWMFVSCTVFVLSGRGLCDGPIPRPEESYRLGCVSECDQVKINNLDTCREQVEEGRAAIWNETTVFGAVPLITSWTEEKFLSNTQMHVNLSNLGKLTNNKIRFTDVSPPEMLRVNRLLHDAAIIYHV
jgi:hypothetical protein